MTLGILSVGEHRVFFRCVISHGGQEEANQGPFSSAIVAYTSPEMFGRVRNWRSDRSWLFGYFTTCA